MDSEEAVAAMLDAGCTDILRWDGSWSSQGSLGPGMDVQPSQRRICRGWLLVYEQSGTSTDNKEDTDTMSKQYTVTPSVGVNIRKGPGTSYAKVGGYAKGTIITVLEERDGWGRTDKGWVKLSNLSMHTSDGGGSSITDRKTDNGITIVEMLVDKGRNNRPGMANPCKYVTIHETGNKAKGADAEAHGAYVRGDTAASSQVSWHYTVDDHAIVQHIPDGETAYHAGDGANGPGNAQSIGIEICVNADGDFGQAQRNAAALVRLLMAEHCIPAANVKQHYDWSAKDCPQTIRATTGAWEAFLALCKGQASGGTADADKPADWADDAWTWAKTMGLLDGTRPAANITRQEVAVVLQRFYKAVKD